MYTVQLKDSQKDIMARDQQTLVMEDIVTMKEALREFKVMVMEVMAVTTRDLLNLDTIITVMDTPMYIKIVITTTDLMDMRLSMITKSDLLMLSLDMDTVATVMSTGQQKD